MSSPADTSIRCGGLQRDDDDGNWYMTIAREAHAMHKIAARQIYIRTSTASAAALVSPMYPMTYYFRCEHPARPTDRRSPYSVHLARRRRHGAVALHALHGLSQSHYRDYTTPSTPPSRRLRSVIIPGPTTGRRGGAPKYHREPPNMK